MIRKEPKILEKPKSQLASAKPKSVSGEIKPNLGLTNSEIVQKVTIAKKENVPIGIQPIRSSLKNKALENKEEEKKEPAKTGLFTTKPSAKLTSIKTADPFASKNRLKTYFTCLKNVLISNII